ncbi:MAG: helix-turn-helix domain-containing protein [Galbitalea sp.]
MTPDEHSRRCTAALKLVADFWVLRIVEELDAAGCGLRFTELQRALGGASPATLSNRLRLLEEHRVLDREGAAGRLSVVYTLSENGRRVLPILRAIDEFAEVVTPA